VKAFDTSSSSPSAAGHGSETIKLYLYTQAFAFYDIGYASAMVVVFSSSSSVYVFSSSSCARAHDLGGGSGPVGRGLPRSSAVSLRLRRCRVSPRSRLPVDAVAFAQEQDRQNRFPPVFIPNRRPSTTYPGVRGQPVLLYTWNRINRHRQPTSSALVGVPAGYGIAKATSFICRRAVLLLTP